MDQGANSIGRGKMGEEALGGYGGGVKVVVGMEVSGRGCSYCYSPDPGARAQATVGACPSPTLILDS